jgi:hypothetical protein
MQSLAERLKPSQQSVVHEVLGERRPLALIDASHQAQFAAAGGGGFSYRSEGPVSWLP